VVSPWELLGLDAEAEPRSIKRRYAQLLKQTRPDEDPEAFQRLREAYEWALDWASGDDVVSLPEIETLEPSEAVRAGAFERDNPAFLPLGETEVAQLDGVLMARTLIDNSESLDVALLDAQEADIEREFELELLRRCEYSDEQRIELLHWGRSRLAWLTSWQADYLPAETMSFLAEQLLERELVRLRSELPRNSAEGFYKQVCELARLGWVQSEDLSKRFQEQVFDIFERYNQADLLLLGRLKSLFGWGEQEQRLPCDTDRWQRLNERLESARVFKMLQQLVCVDHPRTTEQRAVWFLYRLMSDSERRCMADRFTWDDWQECEELDARTPQRYKKPQMKVYYCDDWRAWKPQSWTRKIAFFGWLFTCIAIGTRHFLQPGGRENPLATDIFLLMVMSGVVVLVGTLLLGTWQRVARDMAGFDVRISRWLIPRNCWRNGAGVLLIRHLVPLGVFTWLVVGNIGVSPWAGVLGAVCFIGGFCLLAAFTGTARHPVN